VRRLLVVQSAGEGHPSRDQQSDGPVGKAKGFDGSEVERYFREGKIKENAEYCETDVVGTYQVWLRYELFRGTLSQGAFEASERNLADFMHTC
jgi:3'-5' exonuclease